MILATPGAKVFKSKNSIKSGVLLGAGGEWKRQKISYNSMYLRNSADSVFQSHGVNSEKEDYRRTELGWSQRELLSQQLSGENLLWKKYEGTFSWMVNSSQAQLTEPDNKMYTFIGEDSNYRLETENGSASNQVFWNTMTDKMENWRIDYSQFVNLTSSQKVKLGIGVNQMQRKRKYEVGDIREKIPVKAMLFDIVYLNGKDLTQFDTFRRVEILEENFGNVDDSLRVAQTTVVNSVEELKKLFDEYVSQGLEGVIVKQLSGGYDAGKRNFEWIKIKKSIDRGLVDTIDMVVVGYYYGSGRRAELGIGALLGAVYNEEEDRYDAICKVGTGISDELFKNILENLKGFATLKKTKNVVVNDVLKPDVWVRPKFVITVDADEVTRDISKDKNGVGNGLSLRFPRLVEWDRGKGIENITTVKELIAMFELRDK